MTKHEVLKIQLAVLIEVINSNPNGDPMMDNHPRQLPNGYGVISDVSTKRKIRDMIAKYYGDQQGMAIHVRKGDTIERLNDEVLGHLSGNRAKNLAEVKKALCGAYWDDRAFGGVMGLKGGNLGLRGPVVVEFGQSCDPITPVPVQVSRVCQTREDDKETKDGNGTFGEKWIVPYAVYRQNIHIDLEHAASTSFSDSDLEALLAVLPRIFEETKSAARPGVDIRHIFMWEHRVKDRYVKDFEVRDSLKVQRKDGVEVATKFDDYEFTLEDVGIPCRDLLA